MSPLQVLCGAFGAGLVAVGLVPTMAIAADPPQHDAIVAAVRSAIPTGVSCPDPGDPGAVRYISGSVDLDGDDRPEQLVYLLGRDICGTGGCPLVVLVGDRQRYGTLARISSASTPIYVGDRGSDGWRDLFVYVAGGGAEAGLRVLRFDGTTYPDNASTAPTADAREPQSQAVIGELDDIRQGRLLSPESCSKGVVNTVAQAPPARAQSPGSGVEQQPSSVAAWEMIGGLRIGSTTAEVEGILGPPATRSAPEYWGADGLYHQRWEYPERGVAIGVAADKPGIAGTVDFIELQAPARLRTSRNIGIGDSTKAVERAYPGISTTDDERVIIGDEYDGLFLQLDAGGKVRAVFLGSSAE